MSEARVSSPSTDLGAAKTVGKIRNSLLRADDATTKLLKPFQVQTRLALWFTGCHMRETDCNKISR
jgi:hypothetical protein